MTSLNPKSLNRSLIEPCTSSNRVDSGGNTSLVPGVVVNLRGVSRSIREAILTDGHGLDGPMEYGRWILAPSNGFQLSSEMTCP
jgi:hypothetical protein